MTPETPARKSRKRTCSDDASRDSHGHSVSDGELDEPDKPDEIMALLHSISVGIVRTTNLKSKIIVLTTLLHVFRATFGTHEGVRKGTRGLLAMEDDCAKLYLDTFRKLTESEEERLATEGDGNFVQELTNTVLALPEANGLRGDVGPMDLFLSPKKFPRRNRLGDLLLEIARDLYHRSPGHHKALTLPPESFEQKLVTPKDTADWQLRRLRSDAPSPDTQRKTILARSSGCDGDHLSSPLVPRPKD